ncbi:MAG: ABC transporter ATP-binding protein [Cytophagales bacterium]|nr:ABC transporter ATP-binding protein [Armatimonadota bacterium]
MAEQGGTIPLIAARGITRRFGAFTALERVDFAVRPGEIHALLGENGAGKSTLMNLLSGLLRPSEGEILLNGDPVRFRSPADAERQGIGMVHQHFLLVPPLSVSENLLLGTAPGMGGLLSYPIRRVLDEARSLADRLGWRIPWNAPVGSLPVGTQQRIEILKALRGVTRVLIFDEPTAVLTPTETPELFDTLRRLAGEGRGIVFISHKLDEVLALSETITVLRRGRVVARTRAAETDARSLAEAMVGPDREASSLIQDGAVSASRAGQATVPAGGAALFVENLAVAGQARPLLNGLSFAVSPGEIFGIAGVDGNGQGELADCLAGLIRPSSGTLRIGNDQPAASPGAFRRAGVAVIPADRQTRGLALPLSLTENLALGVYDSPVYRRGPLLLWPALRRRTEDLIRQYDIRATGAGALARSLSGGNQQKVVIARALAENPRVVVAVNPTRGLDVGAIAYVHAALRGAQASGAAIVLISTELEEVLSLATHRVAVLYEGAFSGIVSPDSPRDEIGLLMGGKTREVPGAAAR